MTEECIYTMAKRTERDASNDSGFYIPTVRLAVHWPICFLGGSIHTGHMLPPGNGLHKPACAWSYGYAPRYHPTSHNSVHESSEPEYVHAMASLPVAMVHNNLACSYNVAAIRSSSQVASSYLSTVRLQSTLGISCRLHERFHDNLSSCHGPFPGLEDPREADIHSSHRILSMRKTFYACTYRIIVPQHGI